MPYDSSRNQQLAQNRPSQDGSGNRRKRESRAGTRSVSTLSAAQLERKRANDREAQRTIRQRNREHIESLERQVAELTAKKEQLDAALQHNAVLEVEIDRLKRQLAAVNQQLRYGDVVSTNMGSSSNYVTASSTSSASSSRQATHQSPMLEASSYSPTSPTSSASSTHPHQSSFDGSSINASFHHSAWPPYVLTPGSAGNDGFNSTGYDYFDLSISDRGLKQNSLSQTYSAPMSEFPNTSSGIMYQGGYGQTHYQNAHHGHHQGSYRPRHPPYAHPVLGRG